MPIGVRSALSIHQARPDRHERTDGAKRGSIPEVSFDLCYARAVCWLVATDSQTGFIPVVPLGSKNRIRLIAQELMNFRGAKALPAAQADIPREHVMGRGSYG